MAAQRKPKTETPKTETPDTTVTAESRPGMTFSYGEAEIPASGTSTVANPHQAGIDLAVKAKQNGEQKAFTVAVPTADLDKHKAWLRRGGNASGVTIKLAERADGANTVLTFWAVEKIDRPRKGTVAPTVTETEKADADANAKF